MDFTGSTRTTAATAAAVTLGGLALTLHGAWRGQFTHSLAGVAMTMVALTVIILSVIHRWVTDTRTEHACLAAGVREAQAERLRYIAAQAALENEQARLRRDLNAERAALTAGARAEHEALLAEFEERRGELISDTMEATVRMFHEGRFAPETGRGATIIRLPQQPSPVSHRERSWEHGVVGP